MMTPNRMGPFSWARYFHQLNQLVFGQKPTINYPRRVWGLHTTTRQLLHENYVTRHQALLASSGPDFGAIDVGCNAIFRYQPQLLVLDNATLAPLTLPHDLTQFSVQLQFNVYAGSTLLNAYITQALPVVPVGDDTAMYRISLVDHRQPGMSVLTWGTWLDWASLLTQAQPLRVEVALTWTQRGSDNQRPLGQFPVTESFAVATDTATVLPRTAASETGDDVLSQSTDGPAPLLPTRFQKLSPLLVDLTGSGKYHLPPIGGQRSDELRVALPDHKAVSIEPAQAPAPVQLINVFATFGR